MRQTFRFGARKTAGTPWPAGACKKENGNRIRFPVSLCSSLMPWQRPQGVANGTHRKSGVINRPTSAHPVDSLLRQSAYFLDTPLRAQLQAVSTTHKIAQNLGMGGFSLPTNIDDSLPRTRREPSAAVLLLRQFPGPRRRPATSRRADYCPQKFCSGRA